VLRAGELRLIRRGEGEQITYLASLDIHDVDILSRVDTYRPRLSG